MTITELDPRATKAEAQKVLTENAAPALNQVMIAQFQNMNTNQPTALDPKLKAKLSMDAAYRWQGKGYNLTAQAETTRDCSTHLDAAAAAYETAEAWTRVGVLWLTYAHTVGGMDRELEDMAEFANNALLVARRAYDPDRQL